MPGRKYLEFATVAAGLLVGAFYVFRSGTGWFHRSHAPTLMVIAVCLVSTVIVRAVLPRRWRPSGIVSFLLASMVGFLVVRLGVQTGWSNYLDHRVLEPPGGEADHSITWFFAAAGSAAVLGGLGLLKRRAARRRDTEASD